MLGKIVGEHSNANDVAFDDPARSNLVKEVSIKEPMIINPNGSPRLMAVDCGLKFNQIRCLVSRGARVELVPWDFDLTIYDVLPYDGLFLRYEAILKLRFCQLGTADCVSCA